MCVLYLSEQGSKVKKESHRIFIEKDDVELLEIQTRKLSALCVVGNVQISSQAMSVLADDGIPITYIGLDGKIKGEFHPPIKKNIHLRYNQYELFTDEEFAFELAKEFIIKKINTYCTFYRKIQKNEPVDNCKFLIDNFTSMVQEIEQCHSTVELLGYEGSASRIHFNNFGKFFKNELTFSRRSHYPPEDEVNALLSLGYTMIFKLINGMLIASGLDTYLGFFHKEKYNRPSLACDFEELFRVLFVDAFTLRIANLGILKKKHFEQSEHGPRLTKEGLSLYFTQWKNVAYPTSNPELFNQIQKEIAALIRKINDRIKLSNYYIDDNNNIRYN